MGCGASSPVATAAGSQAKQSAFADTSSNTRSCTYSATARLTVVDSSLLERTDTSASRPGDIVVEGCLTEVSVGGDSERDSERRAMDEYDAAMRDHPVDTSSAKANVIALDSDRARAAANAPAEPRVNEPGPEVIQRRLEALVRRGKANGINGSVHQFVPAPESHKLLRRSTRKVRHWFILNDELKARAATVEGPPGSAVSITCAHNPHNNKSNQSVASTRLVDVDQQQQLHASPTRTIVSASDVMLTTLPTFGGGSATARDEAGVSGGANFIDLPGATGVVENSVEDSTAADFLTPPTRLTENALYLANVAAQSGLPAVRSF